MANKSAGALHLILSGDASPYIAELRRADQETRARAASISGQMTKLGHDLSREFSAAKMGKNLLAGFGVGSGASVIMSGIDHFVSVWRESEEYAKKLEERAENIAELMRKTSAGYVDLQKGFMEPGDRRDFVNKEISRLAAEREEEEAKRARALRGMAFASENDAKSIGVHINKFEGESFVNDGLAMPVRKFSDLMLERADAAQKKVTEIRNALKPLVQDIVALNDRLATESKAASAKQLEYQLQEIALMSGRSAAQVRSDGGEADYQHGMDVLKQLHEEKLRNVQSFADRWEHAGRINVDEMTKRGLGSGANYAEITRQNTSILAEIRDLLKRLELKGYVPKYTD